MEENQHTEWKTSWRDEYIKWICGFANSQGGKLVIGMDDKGAVTGVKGARKLLEDIPNKVRDILGITVDVNLKTKSGKSFLEINVEPYPFPVSYKGQHHYRSGSTKQELKGSALDKFLLQKQGKRWDGVPLPALSFKELDNDALTFFRKQAARSKRLPREILKESNKSLLDKLKLYEGSHLKRAAALLFHPDPEKFVTGAFVKIGFFKTDDDLLYQDTIHGHLFAQVEKTMDLLLTKYLKAIISYEGINRVETYPFPEEALRETLLNSVAHKDYAGGVPIQISVYEDKIIFWNQGQLPDTWTIEKLTQKHPSVPYNPDIATTFFRAGLIESWGRGIEKMSNECRRAEVPIPEINCDFSGLMVTFRTEKTREKTRVKTREKTREKILKLTMEEPAISTLEMARKTGITPKGIEWQIKRLKKAGVLERVGPAKGGYWKVL